MSPAKFVRDPERSHTTTLPHFPMATAMKPDPLENLMSKFDITGQTLALQRNGPTTEDRASSSAANDHEPEPEPHQPPRSASRRSQTSRSPRAPTPAPSGNKHAR